MSVPFIVKTHNEFSKGRISKTAPTVMYEISKVEGNMITIDSTWDANPDKKATTVLKPYLYVKCQEL